MNEQRLNTLRILWAGLFGGTVMFLVVGYLVTSEREAVPSPEPVLSLAFVFSALNLAFGSVWVPAWLQRQSLTRLALVTTAGPCAGPSSERRRPKRFTDSKTARAQLLPTVQPAFIVGMAMVEAVALHGFVLWFLGMNLSFVLPFFVVCWALMVSKFPVLSRFERALENTYDASLV